MLGLPSNWVYVWYEDGLCLNVANSDSLDRDEAEMYRDMWSGKKGHGAVVRVTLERRDGVVWKQYGFAE